MEYVSSPLRRLDDDVFESSTSALYEDSCLYVVPKTHTLPRTETQRAQSMTQTPPTNPLDMPGAIQVTLQR